MLTQQVVHQLSLLPSLLLFVIWRTEHRSLCQTRALPLSYIPVLHCVLESLSHYRKTIGTRYGALFLMLRFLTEIVVSFILHKDVVGFPCMIQLLTKALVEVQQELETVLPSTWVRGGTEARIIFLPV